MHNLTERLTKLSIRRKIFNEASAYIKVISTDRMLGRKASPKNTKEDSKNYFNFTSMDPDSNEMFYAELESRSLESNTWKLF